MPIQVEMRCDHGSCPDQEEPLGYDSCILTGSLGLEWKTHELQKRKNLCAAYVIFLLVHGGDTHWFKCYIELGLVYVCR